MSNPSVVATISANDLASPKIRELMHTLKQAEKLANDAFNGGNMGGKLATGINQANTSAQKHLGLLNQIHSAHKAIASTVAGYASLRLAHGGIEAIKHALPFLREDRAIQARTGYSDAGMSMLRKQQAELASTMGATVEATQKAQEIFGRLKYDAPTNIAITNPTAVGARAMGTTAEHNAELMEAMISQYGVKFDGPADAASKVRHLNDLAAVATKKSNMTFDDVKGFTRYSAAAAHAVGVTPEQNLAVGMALRRGGIVGEEAGVFNRQWFARMMAPTRKGREVAAQNGLNLDEYSGHGLISGEGMSDKFARAFGKRLSQTGINLVNKQLEEHGDEILSDRGKFAELATKAYGLDHEKMGAKDRKDITKATNEYYDYTKEGIKGGALIDAFLAKNSPMLMQAFLGDKQGARGVALLNERDRYHEAKDDLGHSDGYSQKVSDKMNEGLAAATDRLSASFDSMRNSVVQANEGWLTSVSNAGTSVLSSFTNLSDGAKQAGGVLAGIATVAGGGYAAVTFLSFLKNLNSLSASAVEASAALKILAAGGALPGLHGASAKNVAAGTATGLGLASRAFGWLALGTMVGPPLWDLTKSEAAGTDDAGGGGAANYRRRLARLHATEFEDLANEGGPFDRYQSSTWNARRGATSDYLRRLGTSSDMLDSHLGWQDSIRSVAPSSGFKDVAVTGTVTGSAEIHQNFTFEVRPTPYFESLVRRAESVASMSLNGNLGTSMQGPGDNGTKASQSTFTGTQQ